MSCTLGWRLLHVRLYRPRQRHQPPRGKRAEIEKETVAAIRQAIAAAERTPS